MKGSIFLASLLFLSGAASAAAPARNAAVEKSKVDLPTSFQEFVSRAAQEPKWSDVNQSPNKKWVRRFYNIEGMQYDVKKTDSLIWPIVGTVTFTLKSRISDDFDTEREAIESKAPSASRIGLDTFVEVDYAPSEERWKLRRIRYSETTSDKATRQPTMLMNEEDLKAIPPSNSKTYLKRFLP